MTESEMAQARNVYELQTRKSPLELLRSWWASALKRPMSRRERLERKAEVERRARKAL